MAHLLSLFFSQGELANSMPWATFIEDTGKIIETDNLFFHKILSSFVVKIVKNSSVTETPFKCTNVANLISHIDQNYTLYYKTQNNANNLDKNHLIQHAYHGTIFLRILLQITTYESHYNPLFFDTFSTEKDLQLFSKYIVHSIKLLVNLELKANSYKLINELISIFTILTYSLNQKSVIFIQYRNILQSPKRSTLIFNFFFKNLMIIIKNYAPPSSYLSYLYSGATKIMNSLTFNLIQLSTDNLSVSQLSKRSLFLFLFMVYGFKNGATYICNFLPHINYKENGELYIDSSIFDNVKNDKPLTTSTESIESDTTQKTVSKQLKIDIAVNDISEYIIKYSKNDLIGLLSYAFLKDNDSFRDSFSNSSNIELFILEISSCIYNFDKLSYYNSSTILILLLVLTRDKNFVNYLHANELSNIKWLKEESRCNDWNSGNVALFVLYKGLRHYSFQDKDQFTQDNYLGNILNLSFGQICLNIEVSQLLINIFESFTDQYIKMIRAEESSENKESEKKTMKYELVEKVIGAVLQTINVALTENTIRNTALIHRLLLMTDPSEKMAVLQNNSKFAEEVANIVTVLNFYQHKFTQLQNSFGSIDPSYVKSHIQTFAKNSGFLLTANKEYPTYDFVEDTSYTFFISYLKILFENEAFFQISEVDK